VAFKKPIGGNNLALRVRDLSLRFGGVLAVDRMSIDVSPNEIVGLIGPNGAGKTTFINCISGNYRPDGGAAEWNSETLLDRRPHEIIRRGIVRTFQNVASLHDLTVLDVVKLGSMMASNTSFGATIATMFRSERSRDDNLKESVLRPLRLGELADKPLQSLSYGLRKAVDLARALAAHPKLLLLDEPVAGLTSQEGAVMSQAIKDARDRFGCAVMMVEHKMDVVNSTCDRIVVMAAGAKIFEGSAKEVQVDPEVRRVYLGEP
jgi:branched-chain amino acid transport system ATP-binding protein